MANIKDVARKAGVGLGTVSRYLNNSKQISEELKEKIRIAIEETGYVRNELGRNLKTNNPRNIALLIPSIFHNFFSAFAFYIEQELAKYDYKIMI
ncbi:MAG: LacI family transcriptional regulator, partial [Bacillota bacterium]